MATVRKFMGGSARAASPGSARFAIFSRGAHFVGVVHASVVHASMGAVGLLCQAGAPLAGEGVIFLPGTLPGNPFRAGRARSESLAGLNTRSRILLAPFRRLARERRASVGIELAIAALALTTIAGAAFDVISLARASTAGARVAATMADYVSRESEPDGDEMDELGAFLHEREFRNPSALVYVISAVRKSAGDNFYLNIWPDMEKFIIRSGDSETTTDLLARCQTQGTWRTALSGDDAVITLQDNDVVIVVEVCVKMLREGMLTEKFSGILYRIHAMPARGSGGAPEAPTRSSTSEEAAMPARVDAGAVASLHGSLDPANRYAEFIGQEPAVLGGAA